MKRIIVAVTNDLVTDQRVDRTCRALAGDGWAVTLVGRRTPSTPHQKGRKRVGAPLNTTGGAPLSGGSPPYGTRRMRLLFCRSAFFYAEYNLRLFLLLMFSRADCFYANDTDTLLAATLATRLRRKPLFFDAHELFPDVPELQGRPRVQAVWRWVERRCLPHVRQAFTVCQSVADEYRRRYGVQMTVVRNVPDRGEPPQVFNTNSTPSHIRTLLYQGAVNVGRGVGELIDVLQLLPECRLVVAGDGDCLASERRHAASVPWADRVQFLGRVEPERLHALTAQADLGLCLLQDLGLNYRYALPNRIADFAAAGVPILATDFPEIRRVLQHYGTGTLTSPLPNDKSGDSYSHYLESLADDIRQALHYWDTLPPDERARRFAKAGEELNWQCEKHVLLTALHAALTPSR
ncbi:MAG: glycosyltransferase [Bacteroidales bacterium]|nr:glycosyltransferase [Bacteroidales bacterium]